MNDSTEAIITLLIVAALLAVVFIPLVGFIIFVFFLSAGRKKTVNRMLSAHQQLIGNRHWYPVRYASEPRFNAWLKFFPWEAAGILVMGPANVVFLGEVSSRPISLQFAPANSSVNWLGKAPWPNGAVSWFYFGMPDQKHYFSSETGAFVFGSHNSTRKIYEAASSSFTGQV